MPPEFGIGYTGKGSVVLLPSFLASEVGRAKLLERAVYLWLAQQGNHPAQPVKLDGGRTSLIIQRGEWFGSHKGLSERVGIDKKTLARALRSLTLIGAITVEHVERQQRYRKRTVNGGEMEPLNGGKDAPPRSGNRTDVRCLGTLVKVHGWKDFNASSSNGGKNPPQVSTTAVSRVPQLKSAHRAVNSQALAVVKAGAI